MSQATESDETEEDASEEQVFEINIVREEEATVAVKGTDYEEAVERVTGVRPDGVARAADFRPTGEVESQGTNGFRDQHDPDDPDAPEPDFDLTED